MLDAVPFKALGKDYTLRPDFKALIAIERGIGNGIVVTAARLSTGMGGVTEAYYIIKHGLESGSGAVDEDTLQAILNDLGPESAIILSATFMGTALAPPKKQSEPADGQEKTEASPGESSLG